MNNLLIISLSVLLIGCSSTEERTITKSDSSIERCQGGFCTASANARDRNRNAKHHDPEARQAKHDEERINQNKEKY